MIDVVETDALILGAGAGLWAALHAADASPRLRVTVVVKGLLGRAGCTRNVSVHVRRRAGDPEVWTEPDPFTRATPADGIRASAMVEIGD